MGMALLSLEQGKAGLDAAAAAALLAAGDGERKAIDVLRRCVEMVPMLGAAHNNYAIALKAYSRMDEAMRHWQRTVELQPPEPGGRCKSSDGRCVSP